MIEVLDDGSQATIQDRGRFGWRRIGVGASGAMDALAMERANLLCGNPAEFAVVELPGNPLRLRFVTARRFALTGADAPATLDDRPLLPESTVHAPAGSVLRLERPHAGTYSYVAVQGGIDVPLVLGSRSTHLRGAFGGHRGRVLARGDMLSVGPAAGSFTGDFGLEPPRVALALPGDGPGLTQLRVLVAAEHDRLSDAAREAFWSTPWRISAQSNRAGYRLMGPTLHLAAAKEMRSHGLVPGVIQAPDGGTPIIQLADAFTAGGYPKIATIIAADLWRVAQAPLGTALRFRAIDYAEALAAEDALAAYREKVRSWIAMWRERARRESGG